MEEVSGRAPCEHFEANMLTQNCCQNCFHPEEAHRARYQELRSPSGAEAPYCDLPQCPPVSEDPLSSSTSGCQPVVDPGLRPGPKRAPSPSAGLPEEGPTATPRSRSQELEAVPYLEALTSSPRGSGNEDPGSDRSSSPDSATPDDTSNSSFVDWDTAERQEGALSWDELKVMIPRQPQEGPRAYSSQWAPSLLTRSPVRGDAAGQKKEDTGGGGRSAGQHWAKLRGESGYFSLERHQPPLTQASSMTPHSRPRSATPQASPGQRDIAQAASTQHDTTRASSPHQITQRDAPGASSTQQDTSRALSTQRNTPRASTPSRSTQQDNPRTSSNQQNNPQLSSPLRATQQDNPKTSFTQQDNPQTSSPACTPQRENPRTPCAQRDNPRPSSPNRTTQRDNLRTPCAQRDNPRASSSNRDNPRTPCAQRDNPRASSSNRDNPRTPCARRDNPRAASPNRATQRDSPRASATQRDNLRASSPNRTTQRDNPRTPCAQRDNPRASSPIRATQRDNPRTCIQQNTPRSSTQQDKPKTSCTKWDNLRPTCTRRDHTHALSFQRDNAGTSAQYGAQKENLRPSSPHRSTQRNTPRNSSPHRTNKDIPWASFPLRPTQSDGSRTSSPSRSKQSEVPWASIALRPTQGDRPQTSSPSRPAQHDPPQSFSGLTQYNLPSWATSSSHNPGHQSTSRTSSPLYPATCGAPLTSSEPSQPPCAVCIGHRDAPRASSPPRYLQHDPFPFFPEPSVPESESPHHEPPYIPPAVCIGHRDAPRASSPPRHTQFDPFPFLPDMSDAEHQCQSPQHEPLQLPQPVCIGHRDAPRASSPPRQAPEPSLLFQDLPRASTESLVPSMDSLHEPPHIPTPVCIGHRDAPSFSSPPRQAPEPSLFFQDPPGTSMESLAPSTDSLHGSPVLIPQVCIGHRDAPRASSPPRHPPGDLAFLAPSPSPGSSGGSRGSAPPGETRHNLEREEYTVLADLPPPRRLVQRQPGPQAQSSIGARTRSPGRAEVERLFGQERR
ncbi:TRIO and F-actin-binding protein-like [Cebus imitator]|uniref:TRIO and F-actin-binding protein-like n=1 Tax=Cebus imitator TaxID=2715852 RepID=UPI0018996368|nr:TRIO and F-actin-binding protein-like [Cebus imitator]